MIEYGESAITRLSENWGVSENPCKRQPIRRAWSRNIRNTGCKLWLQLLGSSFERGEEDARKTGPISTGRCGHKRRNEQIAPIIVV